MNKPELIIFDCDGVLVDSEIIFNQVLVEYLGERGFKVNLKESMGLFVGGSMESVQSTVEARGIDLPEAWVADVYARVLARLEQGVDPVKGIPELIERLIYLDVPYCVASNGPIHKMELTLGKTGLLENFENRMFSAYEVNIWKPEPGLFLHAANQFSTRAENCVVIEDSGTGTLAAKNAKMPCLGFAPEGPDKRLEENGAICFSSMNDVVQLLRLDE